jgi:hypothetical protein
MDKQPQDKRASALAGRYLTPVEAGRIVGHTPQCIRAYCRRFGLGEFVAGRWLIDRTALERFLRARAGGGHADA